MLICTIVSLLTGLGCFEAPPSPKRKLLKKDHILRVFFFFFFNFQWWDQVQRSSLPRSKTPGYWLTSYVIVKIFSKKHMLHYDNQQSSKLRAQWTIRNYTILILVCFSFSFSFPFSFIFQQTYLNVAANYILILAFTAFCKSVHLSERYFYTQGTNVFSSGFSGLPCLLQFILGYICRITVNVGTLKDGSLLINIFYIKQLFQ